MRLSQRRLAQARRRALDLEQRLHRMVVDCRQRGDLEVAQCLHLAARSLGDAAGQVEAAALLLLRDGRRS